MKNKLLSLVLLSFSNLGFTQTQFWSDTFEDTGAPSSGTRTPSVNNSTGGPPATRYFWRCGTGDISTVNVYSGIEGTKFFAGEGHNLSPASQTAHQNVTWTGINISGKTGLSFRGNFASGNGLGNSWDLPPNSTTADYVILEYRIDAGAWTSGIRFFASNTSISTPLSLETTGDSLGEGVVVLGSAAFTEFTFNIAGTGTTLQLRLKAFSNATSEEWAMDNFRLFYTTSLPVTISSFSSFCEDVHEVVSWTSESESRFDHYELEYSNDLINFKTLAFIPAKGESSESITYNYPIEENIYNHSITYYKLKLVDLDGTINTLPSITAKKCAVNGVSELLNTYSYENRQLFLFFNEPNLQVQLVSLTGQPITHVIQADTEFLEIPLLCKTHQAYLLIVSNHNQTVKSIHKLFL